MENPYASSGLDPVTPPTGGSISPGVLAALAGTKPWVRFCSIIGFIGTGLMVLGAFAMMLSGGFLAASGSDAGMPFAGFPILLGVLYLVIAIFYFFPSLKLWKYGSHIAALLDSGTTADLEAALETQRSFWKFVGILVCVGIALYIVAIIAAVGFSVVGAGSAIPTTP